MAKETANSGNGWICLHRAILDWQHWGEPNVVVVFLTLLLHANTKRKWWQGIRCERGETLVTIDTLSDDTKLSRPTIIRILRLLEDSGEITRLRIDQKHTKTTIKKYAQYQDISFISGKTTLPQTLPQTLLKQQLNNNNNIIKSKYNAHARTHEAVVAEFMANDIAVEQFCMANHIDKALCNQLANDVVTEWELTEQLTQHKSLTDERKHLIAQMQIIIRNRREQGLPTEPLEQRRGIFINQCKSLIEKGCDKTKVAEFARYYTQPATDGSGRMLYETYKGWNTETRFLLNQKQRKAQ